MHARIIPVLLLAAALAGCTTPAADTAPTGGSPPAPVTDVRPELQVPTALAPVDLGIGVGEPSIAAGPNNTVVVADPFMTIWRSLDGGASYTRMGSTGMEGGGDGDIAVDGVGTLHWLGLGGPTGPIPYQRSTDGGDSFGKAKDVSGGKGQDREWIDVRDGSGPGAAGAATVYTTWRDSRGLVFRQSPDGGATWEDPVTFSDDALEGPVTHDPSGPWIYIPYTGGSGTLRIARSQDGVKFDSKDAVHAPNSQVPTVFGNGATSIFPVAAVDQNGTVYLVFSADSQLLPASMPKPAARFGVYLTVSRDHGDSWTDPLLVSNPDHAAIMPWIAAGKPGRIAVVWYENENGAPNEATPDLWDVRLLESVTADQAAPAFVATQLNRDPVHIGNICTGGGSCLLTGGDRSQLDFFEVALRSDGNPVVTWATSTPYAYPANLVVGSADPLQVEIFAGGATGTPLL